MKKEQLHQLDFSSPDDLPFLLPYLERPIELQELTLKQKYDGRILYSTIAAFFSIRLTLQMQQFFDNGDANQIISKSITSSLNIFFSLLAGFFIDVFSIQITWNYFSLINIIYHIILLIGYATYARHLILLGFFVYESLLPVCLINFTCILYEASADLTTRLNNAVKLQIFGFITPALMIVTLDLILNAAEPHITGQNKLAMYISLIISFIMNSSSLYMLSKTHSIIEKLKGSSKKYRQFRITQGMMLSISGICKKLLNIDMIYLFAMQASSSYQIQCVKQKSTSLFINNCQTVIMLFLGMSIGYWVVNYANKHISLVTVSYRIVSICIQIFAVVGVLRLLNEYLFYAEDNTSKILSVSYILDFSLDCIVYALWLISYSVVHQTIIFLLPPRSAIRGITLSSMLFFYFLFELVSTVLSGKVYLIVQAVLSIVVLIFDRYYNSRKSFEELDQVIPVIYSLQNERMP